MCVDLCVYIYLCIYAFIYLCFNSRVGDITHTTLNQKFLTGRQNSNTFLIERP